jgi:hypothetical protein
VRKEIRDSAKTSDEKHEHTAFLLRVLNEKVDAVATDLAAHCIDTEAHGAVYRVRESGE